MSSYETIWKIITPRIKPPSTKYMWWLLRQTRELALEIGDWRLEHFPKTDIFLER